MKNFSLLFFALFIMKSQAQIGTGRADFFSIQHEIEALSFKLMDLDVQYRLGAPTGKVLLSVDSRVQLNSANNEHSLHQAEGRVGLGYPVYNAEEVMVGAFVTLGFHEIEDKNIFPKKGINTYGTKLFISLNKSGDSLALAYSKAFKENLQVIKLRSDIGFSKKLSLQADFDLILTNRSKEILEGTYQRSNFSLSSLYSIEASSGKIKIGPTLRAYSRDLDGQRNASKFLVGGTLRWSFGQQ